MAVATASRARYAHIPAMNWAMPPKTAANGARTSGVVAWSPYHPATLAATMNVAAAKPKSPRIDGADHVVHSICPFCAVGCGQLIYVKNGGVTQIEGDPASPISRGRLCPKGAASKNMHEGPLREYKVKYRPPYGTRWEELP